jgi:flagellum-specific ATP synthase
MGSNPRVDRAIRCRDALTAFLRQRITEAPPLDENLAQLRRALNAPNGAPVAHA